MEIEQEKDLNKAEDEAKELEFVPTSATPPVKEKEPSAASAQVAGYVLMGVTVVCQLMASKRGSHWILSEGEQKQLHVAVARVAEKYISIDMNNPLVSLAAVAGAIFIPRLAVEFMNAEKTIDGGADGDQPKHQMAE